MLHNIAHKNLVLLVLAGAQFMVVLDVTIINVALPSIESALHFSGSTQLQWIVTAYTLVFGGFLLLGGRLADLRGRRLMFLTGIVTFATASLFAGLSQNPTMLIVFRALQGLGGAMLSPAALSLVLSIFREGKERNRALGVWSAVAAGGGAVGLLLGGILTQYVGWRWIFIINVPVAIFLVIMALRYVPNITPENKKQSLDVFGAISVTAGLMALVYGLVKAPQYGWTSGHTIGTLGVAAILLTAFILNEWRTKHPLMPLRIFKNRNVSTGNLMQLPVTAGMFSVFFYLTLYLQQILHFSPVKTGVLFLPFTIFIGITAGITARRIAHVSPKIILVIAPLVISAGLVYFSHIPVDGTYWRDLFPGIVLMASGMGATFVALTLAATSGVPAKESGLASGLLNTSQQIGGALGLAILAAVSTSKTNAVMAANHGNPAVLQEALVQGFQVGFRVAAGFLLAASLIALIGFKYRQLQPSEVEDMIETESESFPMVPGV